MVLTYLHTPRAEEHFLAKTIFAFVVVVGRGKTSFLLRHAFSNFTHSKLLTIPRGLPIKGLSKKLIKGNSDYNKVVDVFVDKNRDLSPLLNPIVGAIYPPLKNKVFSWEEKGENAIPLLPYNFRNSIHNKNDHTPFLAPIVKIWYLLLFYHLLLLFIIIIIYYYYYCYHYIYYYIY